MKFFEEPKIELLVFTAEDVVCTSGGGETPPPMGTMLDPMSCTS